MKSLIVDDDMVSRIKLAKILSSYGECVVTENGNRVSWLSYKP